MSKLVHEIRDPIHNFIRLDSDERRVLDSRPFQRLRHIHQLSLSYLVYPGSSHKRFEHSLGVMELATRIFDVVTDSGRLTDEIRELLPELEDSDKLTYWRRVLRMAALCHDLGHLPFSHAAEKELLPDGWNHERLTERLIRSEELEAIWETVTPPLRPEDLIKVAVGPEKADNLQFTDWETILSEIIVGDVFGADRMDYLLRDSHHAGVVYGEFDHYRLIDTLWILPSAPIPSSGIDNGSDEAASLADSRESRSREPALGIELGGLESAEALLLARYFMYSQVYLHPIRRIYDRHLVSFLKHWLPEGAFPIQESDHLKITDNEVTAAIREAASDPAHTGHEPARRIMLREHFRRLYKASPSELESAPDAADRIREALVEKYTEDVIWLDPYKPTRETHDFSVWMPLDERVESALALSNVLNEVPTPIINRVYAAPEVFDDAKAWLDERREEIIARGGEL